MSLCDHVRETSYAIHTYHGNGYLEKVYENALVNRLRKASLNVKQQHPITIHDEDGTEIGEYFADVIVNDSLIIEVKACKTLANEHKAQLLHYLKAAGVEHGLLINFSSYKNLKSGNLHELLTLRNQSIRVSLSCFPSLRSLRSFAVNYILLETVQRRVIAKLQKIFIFLSHCHLRSGMFLLKNLRDSVLCPK